MLFHEEIIELIQGTEWEIEQLEEIQIALDKAKERAKADYREDMGYEANSDWEKRIRFPAYL